MAQSKLITTKPASPASSRIALKDNWKIKSSAEVAEHGEVLSDAKYQAQAGWQAASVPSTVVAAQVKNGIYRDPLFDMNLRNLPGSSYPIGVNFSNREMPEDSPYRSSWWYRTQFRLPVGVRGENLWLHFDGINYKANIWLNGRQIADQKDVAGTFRRYEFNVSDVARRGRLNTLAVEVFAPHPDDLAYTFVDWNPSSPDKNMGLWHDVYLTTSGPVTIRHPQVVTTFDLPSLDQAHLTVNAEVRNATDLEIEGTLKVRIENIAFSQPVKLAPRETRTVSFTPEEYAQLNLKNPRVWWPVHLGAQNLYQLELEFETRGQISDRQSVSFGVRQVTSEVNQSNHHIFKINGKNILIRGGGWASDIFLRHSPERMKAEFEYVKDLNLNTIRLEGQLESDEFYEFADRYGILVMAGWSCCSHWEHWGHRADYMEGPVWDQEDYQIASYSLTDQVKRLRNHPSVLVWLYGSDNPPPADVEQMYLDVLKKNNWPNPVISSATAKPTQVTGVPGVKMEGPYEWVPPAYWLQDQKLGGAHGLATEISPGPAVPPVESLRRMLPQEHLWPIDDHWNYHAGGGQFKTLTVFTDALNARYGAARDVEDYARKAQMMAYEGQRAMFEGYTANKYTSTGVIQWMLNNAWPSMIWHLYDYYLRPGGGYFGTKKAGEAAHVQFSSNDRSIVVVNNTYTPMPKLTVTAKIYDINSAEKFTKKEVVDLPSDGVVKTFTLPEIENLSPTYFLHLTLEQTDGQQLSSNFYWLSTKDDVIDWTKSTWYYTPVTSYADLTGLNNLKPVKVNFSGRTNRHGDSETVEVTLENPSDTIAFFLRLQVRKGQNGEEILPVIWQDNYLSLLPGEKRQVTATYSAKEMGGAHPALAIDGWNVAPQLRPVMENVKRPARGE